MMSRRQGYFDDIRHNFTELEKIISQEVTIKTMQDLNNFTISILIV